MPFGNKFVDVSEASDPIEPNEVNPLGALIARNPSNVVRLRSKIEQLVSDEGAPAPTALRGGTLYFSKPGRYLIENARPPEWAANLWDRRDSIEFSWLMRRARNPFGGCLYVPPEVTLWLAPGVVLVPASCSIIAIHGPLVCDPTQVFDLSLGGLVVFGTKVPRLLPEWWGVRPDQDHAPAIQAAIDAGIHNRGNVWEQPVPRPEGNVYNVVTVTLPLIPVELRGEYNLNGAVSVRGQTTSNQIMELLGPRGVNRTRPPPGDRASPVLPPLVAHGIIEGAAQTSGGRGARLIAVDSASARFAGAALCEIEAAIGLTVRNVELDVTAVHSTVNAYRHLHPPSTDATPGPALRSCTFVGRDQTLVQIGPAPLDVRRIPGVFPTAQPTNFNWDCSGFVIDDCEFRPQAGGVGLAIRTAQTLHVRVRACEFLGSADAMISSYLGNFLLDGCRFDNRPPFRPTGPVTPGFELPDGSDIFLESEIPPRGAGVNVGRALAVAIQGGFTVTGCVSRSPRFLSSATPRTLAQQYTDWPILLSNVRHVPPGEADEDVSVRWGRQKEQSRRLPATSPLVDPDYNLSNRTSLVIVGGQYRGAFQVLRGCVGPVVVAPRDTARGLMPYFIDDLYPFPWRTFGLTDVFGLHVDSEIRG